MADSVFPITQEEHDRLHMMGWNSGFGWSDQFDWYHNPSSGPAIFVDDDPKWMTRFLDDLETVRRVIAHERKREHGPELYDMLDQCAEYFEKRADVNWEGDGPNTEMSLLNEINEVLARAKGERTDG